MSDQPTLPQLTGESRPVGAKYAEHAASIATDDLELLAGSLPARALAMVREWTAVHPSGSRRSRRSLVRTLADGSTRLTRETPQFETPPRPCASQACAHHGNEAIRLIYEENQKTMSGYDVIPVELVDGGDKVVAVAQMVGAGSVSEIELGDRFAFVFTIRNGRCVREQAFRNREEALEAAGLSGRRVD